MRGLLAQVRDFPSPSAATDFPVHVAFVDGESRR